MSTARPPRTLVLCFDGTGDLYDDTNTNVVKLFSALLKRDDEQPVYYQAGIGTYSAPGIMAGFQLWAAKLFDQAIAWYLDAHVMGGYQFLMQNYCVGDRICLFGFSRGAYTARALAGMLYKVGLLPKDNKEQVGFAYGIYKSTGKKNDKLARGFKETFSQTVQIEFMGCWDTVSSVGLFWGRHLPFTSSNTIIKRFRHALSLDEHRAKFQPNLWHRDAPDRSSARGDPEHGTHVTKPKPDSSDFKDKEKGPGPSDQPGTTSDVLEVWFAGCHSDVGGGETTSDAQHSLSNIPLRWMVREIVDSQCGIQFDSAALAQAGIAPSADTGMVGRMAYAAGKAEAAKADVESASPVSEASGSSAHMFSISVSADDTRDATESLHDELKSTPIWWVLEVLPLFMSWQDDKGAWHRAFRWNFGRGRKILTPNPNVHATVQQRMTDKSMAYVPRAAWNNKPSATWVN